MTRYSEADVLVALLENILDEATSAEADEDGFLPEDVQGRVEVLAQQAEPDSLAELLAELNAGEEGDLGLLALELAGEAADPWEPYQGRRGGKGWKNRLTGRIVYQASKPGVRAGGGQAAPEEGPHHQRPEVDEVHRGIASLLAAPARITAGAVRRTVESLAALGASGLRALGEKLGLHRGASGPELEKAKRVADAAADLAREKEPAPGAAPTQPAQAPAPEPPLLRAFNVMRKELYMGDHPDRAAADFMARVLNGGEGVREQAEEGGWSPKMMKLIGSRPGATGAQVWEAVTGQRKARALPEGVSPESDEDWERWVGARYAAWGQAVSPARREAVHAYVSSYYTILNGFLRTGTVPPNPETGGPEDEGEVKGLVRRLDEVFAAVPPTDRDVRVHRLLGAGPHAEYAAGRKLYEALASGAVKPGSVLEDRGYSSTAYGGGYRPKADGGVPQVYMEIDVPRGSRAVPVEAVMKMSLGEGEVILPRNARFTVKGVRKVGSAYHLQVSYAPGTGKGG